MPFNRITNAGWQSTIERTISLRLAAAQRTSIVVFATGFAAVRTTVKHLNLAGIIARSTVAAWWWRRTLLIRHRTQSAVIKEAVQAAVIGVPSVAGLNFVDVRTIALANSVSRGASVNTTSPCSDGVCLTSGIIRVTGTARRIHVSHDLRITP